MSATLANNADLFLSSSTDAVSMAAERDTAVAKPGFFVRMLEAIGRSYYVPTADGEGLYMFPPC